MPFKISEYPVKSVFNDGDLYDISTFDGVSTYTSEKLVYSALKTNLESSLGFILTTEKGATNGVAELVGGLVPSSQLPSYVDDVIEGFQDVGDTKGNGYDAFYEEVGLTTIIVGELSKIYIDLNTNKTFRWSGSLFVEISSFDNIYSASGVLTGNRNIDLNSNTLTFEDAVGDGFKYYKPTAVIGDKVGISFDLRDDVASRTNYAKIFGGIKDDASGGNEGFISFEVIEGVSNTEVLRLENGDVIAQKSLTVNSNSTLNGLNFLLEQATPLTPSAGLGTLYSFTDGTIHYKNDAGTDFDLTANGLPLAEASQTITGNRIVSGDVADTYSLNFNALTQFNVNCPNGSSTITTDEMFIVSGNINLNATTVGVTTGDLEIQTNGKGLIVYSPDGLTSLRIGIDNGGNIVTTTVI